MNNVTTALTDKQKYQREYYKANKDKICDQKRAQYQPKTTRAEKPAKTVRDNTPKKKTRVTTPHAVTAPAKATSPVKLVDKMPQKARNKIDDILLARELGISVDEL